MSRANIIIAVVLAVIGFTVFSAAFIIREDEQALVLQFGDPKREVKEPGLHFKIPFIQDAIYFDKKILDFDAAAAEVPTQDQKQLVVDAFARYRITEPLKFYQTVASEGIAEGQLNNIISANLREIFGKEDFSELLKPKRAGRGGSVVNIGSVHCHGGMAKLCAYAASKGALNTITLSFFLRVSSSSFEAR